MEVSNSTKVSLSQLPSVLERPTIHIVFEKFDCDSEAVSSSVLINDEITSAPESILSLLKC